MILDELEPMRTGPEMINDVLTLTRGSSPLVLSIPHPGTEVPDEVAATLNERGRLVPDTDWHMGRLFTFIERFQPSIVEARLSRYVVDLNRDPSNLSSLPDGTSGLVPMTAFTGEPIWTDLPEEAEIVRRRERYFRPFHEVLTAEISRAREEHGFCLLLDCHSSPSVLPEVFEGMLPALSLGTVHGASCARAIEEAAAEAMDGTGFTWERNGRYAGGWITRHYGRPAENIHAIQIEVAFSAYLKTEAPPWHFDAAKAAALEPALAIIIEAMLHAATKMNTSSQTIRRGS
jgi:N-formylglutamate deformylase